MQWRPSLAQFQISLAPERSQENAMRAPSGEYCAPIWKAAEAFTFTGGGGVSPFRGRSCRKMFPSPPVTEYARRPCRDTAGIDALLPNDAKCRGGFPESRSIQDRADESLMPGWKVVNINC